MRIGSRVFFGSGCGGIKNRLNTVLVFYLRVIHAVRTQLAKKAVFVPLDALPDNGDAEAMGRQGSIRGGSRGPSDVIGGCGAKGIDLTRRPQMRRKLFGEYGGRVYPIILFQFPRQF